MLITERVSDEVLVIEPKGRLTVETEPDFASYFIRLLEAGHRHFALSLAEVPYIDSVGLGSIVRAYTSARRRGGDFKLLNVEGRNRHLLEITKLWTVLNGDPSPRSRSIGTS
jgi:anti-sigma B factor antagonist